VNRRSRPTAVLHHIKMPARKQPFATCANLRSYCLPAPGGTAEECIVFRRGLTRFELWLCVAVFGGAACYCLIGAISGHLYMPNRYHRFDAILSGPAAWALFFSVLGFWLAVMVREQVIFVPTKRRVFWEFLLLMFGLGLLACSIYLPYATASAQL
jgi:hypothetical protein